MYLNNNNNGMAHTQTDIKRTDNWIAIAIKKKNKNQAKLYNSNSKFKSKRI